MSSPLCIGNVRTTLGLDIWRDFASWFYGLMSSPENASKNKVYEGSILIDSTLSGYFKTLQCSDLRLCISFAFGSVRAVCFQLAASPQGFLGSSSAAAGWAAVWAAPQPGQHGCPIASHAIPSHLVPSRPISSCPIPQQLSSGCRGALQSSCEGSGMGLWFPNCGEQHQFDSDLFRSLNMMPDSLFWQLLI